MICYDMRFSIILLYVILPYKLNCLENYNFDDNINKYLFKDQQFQFVDLTLNLKHSAQGLSSEEKRTLLNYLEVQDIDPQSLTCQTREEWFGTSMDLGHRGKLGPTWLIDQVPLQNLVLPLIVADISSQVNGNPNFVLHRYHLDYFLNNYFGQTEQPCIVVFKFGWSKFHRDGHKYFGFTDGNHNQTLNFPGISEDVSEWITKAYKNIVGIGVDLPSVDQGLASYTSHNTLTGAKVFVIENLDLDRYLPDASCTALVLPEKIHEKRAPVRFLAICPKSKTEFHEIIPWHRL